MAPERARSTGVSIVDSIPAVGSGVQGAPDAGLKPENAGAKPPRSEPRDELGHDVCCWLCLPGEGNALSGPH
jgi:hypothetical protein